MAGALNKKISATSAKTHNGWLFWKVSLVLFVGIWAWAYQAILPPPPKICGSPGGPPITGPRIKLRDGRHLAYKEYGISKDVAKYKIISLHGLGACRHDPVIEKLSPEIVEELGVYIVTIDRPGYGESDPHPSRTLKSFTVDIVELADQLELGSKFYMIGNSMGGQLTWTCLKYIPHRLAGASLLAPAINFWWPGFPANLLTQVFNQLLTRDQWALRVAYYTPWLSYWWNTQKWFPGFSALDTSPGIFSQQDKEIMAKLDTKTLFYLIHYARQQGDAESYYRDLAIGFGKSNFDPMDLENAFPNHETSVHLWQGDQDLAVPLELQRYIVQRLPWIRYHELSGYSHMFPMVDGLMDKMIKVMLVGE